MDTKAGNLRIILVGEGGRGGGGGGGVWGREEQHKGTIIYTTSLCDSGDSYKHCIRSRVYIYNFVFLTILHASIILI